MKSRTFTLIGLTLSLVLAISVVLIASVSSVKALDCGTHLTTDLATWDLSQTRTQGHNQIIDGGLHIWTESNTSLDKAAGYYPLSAALSTVTSGSIVYNATLGITPGLQLVVDFNGDNTIDGILVGEAVYGENWWLTNSAAQFVKDGAPHTGGGNGSDWFGTLTEWGTSFPNAMITAIGYSLGSGVHGDGVITSMTFGCYVFTFDLPEPTATPTNTPTQTPTLEPTEEVTPDPEETDEPTPEVTETPGPEVTETPMAPPVIFALPSGGFACRVFIDAPMTGRVYAQIIDGDEWGEWNGMVLQDSDKEEAPGMTELSLHPYYGETTDHSYYRVVGEDTGVIRYFERIYGGVCVEINDPLAAE